MSDKVVYASADVTLHTVKGSEEVNGNTVYNVESVVLVPGESLELDKLPPYQQKAVLAGKVPGVQVVSAGEAEKLAASWTDSLPGPGPSALTFYSQTKTGPDADDGSYSDHELSDEERGANHAARGEAEAGSADAPSGRKTRKSVAGEAEASEGKLLEDDK